MDGGSSSLAIRLSVPLTSLVSAFSSPATSLALKTLCGSTANRSMILAGSEPGTRVPSGLGGGGTRFALGSWPFTIVGGGDGTRPNALEISSTDPSNSIVPSGFLTAFIASSVCDLRAQVTAPWQNAARKATPTPRDLAA